MFALAVLAVSVYAPFSAGAEPSAHSRGEAHPFVMQWAAQEVAAADVASVKPFTAAPRTAAVGTAGGPQREIFGFALASSLSDPTVGYPTWNFSLLTTVAFFGLHVNDDGTLANDSGLTVWNSSALTGLLTTAHASGTRVVVTVILQDFSVNTPHMCSALANASTTVSNAVAQLKAKGVDGINVDYEGENGSCGTTDPSWARHHFVAFVAALRAAMPAGTYLSVDTYASSASDPLGFFDIQNLASSVDAFFVMAYDLEYSNYSHAPLNCIRFCLGPTAPLAGYYWNDTTTAAQYKGIVPASKVILGVPYYGRKSCVAAATPNAYPTSSVIADTYLDASQEGTNPGPGFQAGTFVAHRDANDPAGGERWDTWYNTNLNCTRELYWDDTVSLGNKYDLINADNLRGVGIWNLNYGGGAPELWRELDLKFGAGVPRRIGGLITSGPDASSWGASRTDVFVRGSEGGVWDATFNGSSWSWTFLGGLIQGDPTAVSWGSGRIDIFVRGVDNALWHRAFTGAGWAGWEKLGGVITSGPDAASWAVNRLDVFVRGSEGGLWDETWTGTAWVWQPIGGVITSDPGAIAPATNRLHVFVRGLNNSMWDASWSGAAWSWTLLGGLFASGPDASSCASGHADVFAVGADHKLWQRGFNGTSWGAWQPLGGSWPSDPGAVCPSGSSTVSVFERGSDGALWEMGIAGT